MILITKNKEPKEWTEYRNTPGVDYQAIYKKDGVNFVYTNEDHRVEHIKSRELHDDLKLDYTNMVVCCPGHIGAQDHCDRLKGPKDISFSPRIFRLVQLINNLLRRSDTVPMEKYLQQMMCIIMR